MENPFALFGYTGPATFCDREEETRAIMEAIEARRNLTLFAIRRLGKSGLILHVFHKLPKKKYLSVYVDAMASRTEMDFVSSFITATTRVLAKDNRGQGYLKKLTEIFSRLRPKIAFDPITGLPAVELDLQNREDAKISIETAFRMLAEESKQVIIAMDEFQQVAAYPDSHIEALFRSYMQAYPKLRFIFSGSQRHILVPMFSNAGNPLYRSTQMMQLGKISEKSYSAFIHKHFSKANCILEEGVAEEILQWTHRHTYYTQYVCNRLFSKQFSRISTDDLHQLKHAILEENAPLFYQFERLLPQKQWDLLRAIALEDGIDQPLAKDFIYTHQLGTPSTVQGALEALLKKDMIYENYNDEAVRYQVNDVFLTRWLQEK